MHVFVFPMVNTRTNFEECLNCVFPLAPTTVSDTFSVYEKITVNEIPKFFMTLNIKFSYSYWPMDPSRALEDPMWSRCNLIQGSLKANSGALQVKMECSYSFSQTTFSLSGTPVQTENVLAGVGGGAPSPGIKAANGVVLATGKKQNSTL